MGNCLQQPGQLLSQPQKSMRVTSSQLIMFCIPGEIPAAVTKSIGLLAIARCCSFCTSPRQLYLDEKLSPCLPGLSTYPASSGRETTRPFTGTQPSRQICLDEKSLVHLPGFLQKPHQPRHRRQLPIPPGRQTV